MHPGPFVLLSLSSIGIVLAACGGDPSPAEATSTAASGADGGSGGAVASGGGGAGGTAGSGGAGPITVDLTWRACSLYSDGTGPAAECATPGLPLHASDPAGEKLPMYVKRYASAGSSRETQLWMLSGGPGSSGMLYEKLAEVLAEGDSSLEIYMPDHRGTGDSSRLGCPTQESDGSTFGFYIAPSEWNACAAAVENTWGDKLAAFTVTNAANDVGILVESSRREGARVFVYGASYGTFWAQRYAQLFPHQADGIVLDAIAPPDASLARQDIDADTTSALLFKACTDDPDCGPRLGGDPRAFALDLYERLDTGHCPGIQTYGSGRILLRRAFGQMMMSWNARRLIPAALVRADRCAPADVDALGTLLDYYFLPNDTKDLLLHEWGWVLSYYVTFSELWETPEVTTEQMAAWRDAAVVSRDVTSGFDAPLAVLPRYPHDRHYLGFADTDVPILMLQGTWDPATVFDRAEAVKRAFTAPNQYSVEIPRGAHGALATVPTTSGDSCGTRILSSFLDDPKSPPDTSCLDEIAPFTFDGTAALNTLLFGTEDAWGSAP